MAHRLKSVIVRVKNRLAAWEYKTKDFYRLRVPTRQNVVHLFEEAVVCNLLFSLLTFNYCLVSSRSLIHSRTFDDAGDLKFFTRLMMFDAILTTD